MKLVMFAVSASLLVASHGAAWSADALRIELKDLDLRSEEGARIALERVATAVDALCRSSTVNGSDLGRSQARQRCIDSTLERTVLELGAPIVTKAYENGRASRPSQLKEE